MRRKPVKPKSDEERKAEQRRDDAAFWDEEKWDKGFDGQRYTPIREDDE